MAGQSDDGDLERGSEMREQLLSSQPNSALTSANFVSSSVGEHIDSFEDEHHKTMNGVGSSVFGLRQRVSQATTESHSQTGSYLFDHVPPSGSHRILDRDGQFNQSRGKWRVNRISKGVLPGRNKRSKCCVCWDDWFHSLAYQPTLVLMGIIYLAYTATVVFFAYLYLLVSKVGEVNAEGNSEKSFCGMDITNQMEALYFSLSTMTTIGYGVSDYYFGDCWTPIILVLLQIFAAMTFDAIAIGLLFQRISRGQKRGKTIVFSDKAVVRRVRGQPHFMFRFGELRRHHIIDAHVRVYCLRHERYPVERNGSGRSELSEVPRQIETAHFVSHQVRLSTPNESVGSFIMMSIPQVVVHKMDHTSPMMPPRIWYDADGVARGGLSPVNFLRNEVLEENGSENPEKTNSTHVQMSTSASHESAYDQIKLFMMDRDVELVVLVEGTDELTGSALQARHSYRWDDIEWDHTFAPCVRPCSDDDDEYLNRRQRFFRHHDCGRGPGPLVCRIDFSKFHDVLPAPLDCAACPYVPESAV